MNKIEENMSIMTKEELESALKLMDDFVYEELCKALEMGE